ncbi:MAG: LytTR family DNA-binding domain-containing protein [Muribaculaceae bacterium]|nr:LytTR family DNA-binding domain-containing protein [Muribaculaceae bacterium]
MTTLKCCVVDDEPLAAELIADYIRKTPFMELCGVFASAQDAVKCILGNGIDIVFLDIQMPQLNGMEFAKIIPSATRIIFTTAYREYAMEGWRVDALDYLLKPVSYEEFAQAANKALRWFDLVRSVDEHNSESNYMMVKSDYKIVQICLDDILYIEGLKDYVRIYMADDRRSVMTLMSMRSLEQRLPSDRFMRVHRSYIVNTARITVIERNRIVFGDAYIPVSGSYRQAFSDFVASRSLSSGLSADEE